MIFYVLLEVIRINIYIILFIFLFFFRKEEYDILDPLLNEYEIMMFSVEAVPGNYAYRNIIFVFMLLYIYNII